MKLRTGRHNDRIVYLQLGPEPHDTDPMVAVFFRAGEAAAVIRSVNEAAPEPSRFWRCFSEAL